MTLQSTWHAHATDKVDVRPYPARGDERAFVALRFLVAPSDLFPDFSIQSTSPAALRAIAAAATEAADWLETSAARGYEWYDDPERGEATSSPAPKPGPHLAPAPPQARRRR